MAATPLAPAAAQAGRRLAYRLAIPAAALLLFTLLALLWQWGPHALYFDVLALFGFEPFRFPFLDIHAVLAAAECQRLGVDVYLSNPCDVLGRPHVYSPLWLTIIPRFLDTTATTAIGLSLDLMFILSLLVVIRPASRNEMMVIALAALSPMTVYALERANCDLVIFLVILAGCALGRAPRPWRLGSYALFLAAGLLKYYPLMSLVLLVREQRRVALVGAGLAASVIVLLVIRGHADLAEALANIPALSYFSDSFSALNLPFGFVGAVGGIRFPKVIAVSLLTALAAIAIARTRRTVHLLEANLPDAAGWEGECLLVGALLVTACFFAAQNIDYRGIYFVLVMPGLVRLHRNARDAHLRRFLARMIAAVLFVAWEEPLRHAVHMTSVTIVGDWLRLRVELLFWIGRELVWWWLIAGLAAIVLSNILRMPLVRDGHAALHYLRPGHERRQRARS
jgi:hypothetical protein